MIGIMARRMTLVQNMASARLAQLVERKALNLVVVGLSPTVGGYAAPPPYPHKCT